MAALDFPDNPATGDLYGSSGTVWRWDGSVWNSTAGASGARGRVAYAQVTASQSGFVNAGTPVTGLSITFTANPTRVYRTTACCSPANTVATATFNCAIVNASSATVNSSYGSMPYAQVPTAVSVQVVETGLSGSTTRSVWIANQSNNGTLTNSAGPQNPSFILVEDITYEAGTSGVGIEPTVWVTATLGAGWTHQPGEPIQFRKNKDVVEMRGRAGGTTGTILTLPIGYRPAIHQPQPASLVLQGAGWSWCVVYVQSDGAIAALGSAGAYTMVSLSGVTFSVTP